MPFAHQEKGNRALLLEEIINSSPAIVFLWRIASGWPVEYVSENIRILGYTPDDFLSGKVSWPGITHPEDVPRLETEVEKYLSKGQLRFSQEYRLQAANGEWRWIRDWNHVVMDEKKIPSHVQGFLMDITTAKKTEEDRARLQKYLEALAGDTPTGLLPICMHCKSIREEPDKWEPVESFLENQFDVKLTHGLCPDCAKRFYPAPERPSL